MGRNSVTPSMTDRIITCRIFMTIEYRIMSKEARMRKMALEVRRLEMEVGIYMDKEKEAINRKQ